MDAYSAPYIKKFVMHSAGSCLKDILYLPVLATFGRRTHFLYHENRLKRTHPQSPRTAVAANAGSVGTVTMHLIFPAEQYRRSLSTHGDIYPPTTLSYIPWCGVHTESALTMNRTLPLHTHLLHPYVWPNIPRLAPCRYVSCLAASRWSFNFSNGKHLYWVFNSAGLLGQVCDSGNIFRTSRTLHLPRVHVGKDSGSSKITIACSCTPCSFQTILCCE